MALTPGRTVVVRKAWAGQFRSPFGLFARLRQPVYINSASTLPRSHLDEDGARTLRLRYAVEGRRLIVFFGFLHPHKRIELLFQIADPVTDHLLVIGNVGDQSEYAALLEAFTQDPRWRGHARIVGFVDRHEAADILKAADALVLPLKAGGGEWNTAILAGVGQGTFVLTTSTSSKGYDPEANTYYAAVDDLVEMQHALKTHAGRRRHTTDQYSDAFDWGAIARRHIELYQSLVGHHGSLRVPSSEGPT
jgi:glycosyltransferase involved in cell wall biosynthesis